MIPIQIAEGLPFASEFTESLVIVMSSLVGLVLANAFLVLLLAFLIALVLIVVIAADFIEVQIF